MTQLFLDPWPWYVAGPLISLTMFLLIWFGQNFGVSNNLRTMCVIGGGSRLSDFFNFSWKKQAWNLVFVLGAIIGGTISLQLSNAEPLQLNPDTVASLHQLGFGMSQDAFLPPEIFGNKVIYSISGLLVLVVGGFLVGFGARYAGGCTSGHAISGLSNLQLPSLISVIGFFIGGLFMVYAIMPFIFS